MRFALRGQFKLFDAAARDQRIASLARVIPNGPNCYGVATWVSKQDFVQYCSEAFHPAWHDPYYLCAFFLIQRLCADLASPNLTKLDFIFDRQGKVGVHFKAVYDAVLKPNLMTIFPFVGDVRQEDKRDFVPLQAADMQAGWVRRSESTIKLWTNADAFVGQIAQRHHPVPRRFLEYIQGYSREHKEEIAAWGAELMKRGKP
jgi:hypothetical protein